MSQRPWKLAIAGIAASAITALGVIAGGVLVPSSPSAEVTVSTSAGENIENSTEASPNPSETSSTLGEEETSVSTRITESPATVDATQPSSTSEPEPSIEVQLKAALDLWIIGAKSPKSSAFKEEEGIFQGCPEDMCGPIRDLTFEFPRFPSDFGNTSCEALINIRDKSTGKLLNRHAEEWTLLGNVHVGVQSLTSSVYLDGLPPGGVVSASELKVSCRTIHGVTEARQKFEMSITTSE
jgi:hypothetical protein